MAFAGDDAAWYAGLVAALCGATSFAAQAVLFEGAAARAPGSTAVHVCAFALYGLLANALALCALHGRWLLRHRGHALHGATAADVVCALSIAMADVTMTGFFSYFDANAYSFSRVLALVVSGALANAVLGLPLTWTFVLGAAIVVASSFLYHECTPEVAARRLHLGRSAEQSELLDTP